MQSITSEMMMSVHSCKSGLPSSPARSCAAADAAERIFDLVGHSLHDFFSVACACHSLSSRLIACRRSAMLSSTSKQPLFSTRNRAEYVYGAFVSGSCRQWDSASHHGVVLGYRLTQQWVPFIGLIGSSSSALPKPGWRDWAGSLPTGSAPEYEDRHQVTRPGR